MAGAFLRAGKGKSFCTPAKKPPARPVVSGQAHQLQRLPRRLLFGDFFGMPLSPADAVGVEVHFHHKMLVVVRAAFPRHHIAQPLFGILLHYLLQPGLVVLPGGLALGDKRKDKGPGGFQAAVQVDGGDHRLEGVGEDAGPLTAAAAFLPLAQAEIPAQLDLLDGNVEQAGQRLRFVMEYGNTMAARTWAEELWNRQDWSLEQKNNQEETGEKENGNDTE